MPLFSTLTENWATIDTAKWNKWGGANITNDNGELTLTNAAGTTNYFGITSVNTFDLTGSSVSVRIVSVPTVAAGDTSYSTGLINLEINSDNRYYWEHNVNGLTAYKVTAGSYVTQGATLTPSASNKYLKIEHQNDGNIHYLYSADGITWTDHAAVAITGVAITALYFSSAIGHYNVVNNTYTTKTDDINIVPTVRTHTQNATVRIQKILTHNQSATARIQKSLARDQSATARTSKTISFNQSATANINAARAKSETLTDDFAGTSVNADKWVVNGASTSQSNEQLVVSYTAGAASYSGYDSKTNYDAADSYIYSRLIDAGNQSLATWQVLPVQIYLNASNTISWIISTNKIIAQTQVAGTYTDHVASTTYDPAVHKYFRLRETAGTIYWDYSADAITWTNYFSLATPFTVSDINIHIAAGAYTAETTDTSATFDDFNQQGSFTATLTQPATARIAHILTDSQSATSRIAVTDSLTQTATAQIAVVDASQQTATARISKVVSFSQSAASRIAIVRTTSQTATAQIAASDTLQQNATARLQNTQTKTQTATAHILAADTKTFTQSATASIRQIAIETQTATAQIARILSTTQSATTQIAIIDTSQQNATARIATSSTRTQTATARISTTDQLTQQADARIAHAYSLQQSATARIDLIRSASITATASINQMATFYSEPIVFTDYTAATVMQTHESSTTSEAITFNEYDATTVVQIHENVIVMDNETTSSIML